MTIIMSLFLVIGPVAIIYCVVKAIQHTIVIRQAKREDAPPWLINSIMNANGPDRKWGIK